MKVAILWLFHVTIRICIPNKTEDANVNVFFMTTGINESKTLRKHISHDCKCKVDDRKFNSNERWRRDKSRYESKINRCLKITVDYSVTTCELNNKGFG